MSTTPHDMSEEIAKLLNSFGHKVALNHRNSTEGYATSSMSGRWEQLSGSYRS
jgi:hypothetical protein